MKSYVIKLEDKSAFTNICKSKNIMFKAFLEGLEKSWQKPDFGMYKNATNYPWKKMRDDDTVRDNYLPEFRKAFADAGVIAKPATPPANPA